MRSVPAPPLARNDNAKARLAQTRDALKEANQRLESSRTWYDRVRDSFRVSE